MIEKEKKIEGKKKTIQDYKDSFILLLILLLILSLSLSLSLIFSHFFSLFFPPSLPTILLNSLTASLGLSGRPLLVVYHWKERKKKRRKGREGEVEKESER